MFPSGLLAALVAISVSGTSEDAKTEIVASCETALGEGECSARAGDDPAPLRADVRFEGDHLRVELTAPGDETPSVRQLAFSEDDRDEQRFVAAGLLVAAMTASRIARKEAQAPLRADPAEPAPAPLEPPTKPPPVPPKDPPNWGLDLGVLVAPATSWTEWRLGGEIRGGFAPSAAVGWTWALQGAHSVSAEPSSLWVTFGTGPIFDLLPRGSGFRWWWTIEGVGQIVWITVKPPSETQSAWRYGGRVGTRLALGRSRVAPWLGLEATALGPEVVVRVDGQVMRELPIVAFGALLGGRFQLGPE